jgi:hypothetical protein
MVEDNLRFFCADHEELLRLGGAIYRAASFSATLIETDGQHSHQESERAKRYQHLTSDVEFSEEALNAYHWGHRMFKLVCPEGQREVHTDAEFAAAFREGTLLERLFFYLWLRTPTELRSNR